MIEQYARVVQVAGGNLEVVTEAQSACGSCDVKSGCGTSLVARLFPQRPQQRMVVPLADFGEAPRPGDRVLLGIEESHVQATSLLLYLVPLAGLLGGALVGSLAGAPSAAEPFSIAGGLLGLILGLRIVRSRAAAYAQDLQHAVRLLRVEPAGVTVSLQVDPAQATPQQHTPKA